MIPTPSPFPEDGPVIRVHGLPSAAEWRHAIRLFRRAQYTLGRKLALAYFYGLIALGWIYAWRHEELRVMCYIFPATLTLLILGSRWYTAIVLRESLAKRDRIGGEDEWTFSSTRVLRVLGVNHATHDWRYLEQAVIANDMLLLFPTSTACHCIPLRCFANPEDMATVAGWAMAAGVPLRDLRKGTP
ncbi:hypothetical protein [Luteolibacter sp. LG18]|uniref:hypothetical protein n=1 Tax=Luteolibacter sp. LG18 TaxID=2819286 RepID=UPI002B31737A|nr:hypothetical protein llg_00600 [Luteolibacter sp. LG18]